MRSLAEIARSLVAAAQAHSREPLPVVIEPPRQYRPELAEDGRSIVWRLQ